MGVSTVDLGERAYNAYVDLVGGAIGAPVRYPAWAVLDDKVKTMFEDAFYDMLAKHSMAFSGILFSDYKKKGGQDEQVTR